MAFSTYVDRSTLLVNKSQVIYMSGNTKTKNRMPDKGMLRKERTDNSGNPDSHTCPDRRSVRKEDTPYFTECDSGESRNACDSDDLM